MAEFQIKTSENGKVQGPFSSGQLKKLAGQGKLRPEHLVSANGGASWHPATRVSGLEFPSPAPRLESTPPSPRENSPGPKKLPRWMIGGGAIGVLCLVVIAGGVGFLIATGSGDDGSYPTIELDSSGELPSVDVLSDGPDTSSTEGGSVKGFIRVKGKQAGTSKGNEKEVVKTNQLKEFGKDFIGQFLVVNPVMISNITRTGFEGTGFLGITLYGESSFHEFDNLFNSIPDENEMSFVVTESFAKRLLDELPIHWTASDKDPDRKIHQLFCEVGIVQKYGHYNVVARVYKIGAFDFEYNPIATFEDK